LKLQLATKTKRIRDLPTSFAALQSTVEQQIKEERLLQQQTHLDGSFMSAISVRDYVIRYIDGDQEAINVSDDEDLLTAYEVAENDLKGNLKFIVSFKPQSTLSQLQKSATMVSFDTQALQIPKNPIEVFETNVPSGSLTQRPSALEEVIPAFSKAKTTVTKAPEESKKEDPTFTEDPKTLKKLQKEEKALEKARKAEKAAKKLAKKEFKKLKDEVKRQKLSEKNTLKNIVCE
jgi:hypothetical protein